MEAAKHLIIDYFPFHVTPQQIQESIDTNHGKLIVSGVVQRADAYNQNGRTYPKSILEREVQRYIREEISENRALGELDHPDSAVVNLNNASHNILELRWDNNDLIGKIEILTTPAGNILRELLKSNIRLGISSRGMGSVKHVGEGLVEVQNDFKLVCFDFVSSPSTHGAFMNLQESKQFNEYELNQMKKYQNINSIISGILSI